MEGSSAGFWKIRSAHARAAYERELDRHVNEVFDSIKANKMEQQVDRRVDAEKVQVGASNVENETGALRSDDEAQSSSRITVDDPGSHENPATAPDLNENSNLVGKTTDMFEWSLDMDMKLMESFNLCDGGVMLPLYSGQDFQPLIIFAAYLRFCKSAFEAKTPPENCTIKDFEGRMQEMIPERCYRKKMEEAIKTNTDSGKMDED